MADKERKLTEAEIRRSEAFKVREEGLTAQGYVRKDLTISILKANVVGILLTLPFIAAVLAAYYLRNGGFGITKILEGSPSTYFLYLGLVFLTYIPLAAIHEGIHGLCWSRGAENGFKDIEFGFIKENLTPYCTCSSPLSKPMYIFGSLMPMTILGIVLGVVSVFIASPLLLVIAVIQTTGGAGDILISVMLLAHKMKDKDAVLLDHPTDCGLVVFEKANG